MKNTKDIKRFFIEIFTGIYILTNIVPFIGQVSAGSSDKVVNPFKTVAKLNCRFQDFDELSSDCKQSLPTLNTKDYKKYATKNGGYNDFTRYYTVLWGSSYKYGWDVGNGGHLGTDIATSKGTPIYSISDGKVISAKSELALGNFVTVEHNIRGKKIFSNYLHMSKITVKAGDTVRAGDKLGEVGSTGNSTGNHLHFQIDLDTPFHPYYPDYKACPYSYYDITEKGVCFDEIKKNTIDPLLFLETEGKILDSMKIVTSTVSRSTINSSNKVTAITKTNNYSEDLSIFDRTVYTGYSSSDIKKVQEIFKNLGEYNGKITGDYTDIESSIIDYQLSNNLISSRDEYGAGWFGPKTRKQSLHDYKNYLDNHSSKTTTKTRVTTSKTTKTEKISRVNLLTREEIEAREIKDFLRFYNIDLNLNKVGGNISVGETIKLNVNITSRGRNKSFKGNTPLDITFGINDNLVSVFPKKIYYFTDGKRSIKLSGLKPGNTVLQVKMGSKVIKKFNLKVFNSNTKIYPSKALVVSNKSIVLGETKKGIVLFKDDRNKKLINIKYDSTFTLKGAGDTQVCLKSGSLSNIKRIYTKTCKPEDFKKSINFSYNDTVGGLVIFDYKTTSKDAKIEVMNNYNSKLLGEKKLYVTNPKGLKNTYAYYKDVVDMLALGVTTGIKKGYFLEDRSLTQSDALVWIENTLGKIKDETLDSNIKNTIDSRLRNIKNENVSRFNPITRQQFLDYSYKYLSFNNLDSNNYREYRDLDDNINKKVNIVFDTTSTWKDKFGENYFRPDMQLTRGEGAYFLNQVISKQRKLYLVSN